MQPVGFQQMLDKQKDHGVVGLCGFETRIGELVTTRYTATLIILSITASVFGANFHRDSHIRPYTSIQIHC